MLIVTGSPASTSAGAIVRLLTAITAGRVEEDSMANVVKWLTDALIVLASASTTLSSRITHSPVAASR